DLAVHHVARRQHAAGVHLPVRDGVPEPPHTGVSDVTRRELEYHEKLYSGFAQQHFARPAVRALRAHIVGRILQATGAGAHSLDPSRRRLSGAVGRLLIPGLMKRYQTEDERELEPEPTAALFHRAGFDARVGIYDFGSSPLAGLFPGWRTGYQIARTVDDWIL